MAQTRSALSACINSPGFHVLSTKAVGDRMSLVRVEVPEVARAGFFLDGLYGGTYQFAKGSEGVGRPSKLPFESAKSKLKEAGGPLYRPEWEIRIPGDAELDGDVGSGEVTVENSEISWEPFFAEVNSLSTPRATRQ